MPRSRFAFRWKFGAILVGALTLILSGCAETQLAIHSVKKITRIPKADTTKKDIETIEGPDLSTSLLGEYKVGDPYEVGGVWYYPKANSNYDEVGIASWYGPKFHGKITANGAVYDMNALTAAHKTLPMPSKVRVTNLDNGRSLILDVNDRGPFVNGRIIDLSRRASQLLGFERNGLAMVRVQAISAKGSLYVAEKLDTPPDEQEMVEAVPSVKVAVNELTLPDGAVASLPKDVTPVANDISPTVVVSGSEPLSFQSPEMFLQVGAFLQENNASTLSGRLSHFAPVRVIPVELDNRTYYRVRLGPVMNVDEADELLQRLISSGYTDARLVLE